MNRFTPPPGPEPAGCVELHNVAAQCLALLGQWDSEASGRVSLQVMPNAAVRRQGNPLDIGVQLLNWVRTGLRSWQGALQLHLEADPADAEWVRVVLSPDLTQAAAGEQGQQRVPPVALAADGLLAVRPLPEGAGAIGALLHLPPLSRAPEDGAGLRVLLVEDNLINAETTREMLCSASDIRVEVAHTGAQALAALSQHTFDVVLMDMFLPDTDGVVLTRRIRRTLSDRAPAIVALTANAYPSDRELCICAGMVDFLVKPVSLARLQETVRRWAAADPDRAR